MSGASSVPLRSVCVFGGGSVGCWLVAHLHAAGIPTALYARGEQAAAIDHAGLTLLTPTATLSCRPRIIGPQTADLPVFDVVLVAIKAYSLPAAAGTIASLVSDRGVCVLVQNGIPYWFLHAGAERVAGAPTIRAVDPEGDLSSRLPVDRVLGGIAYCGATVTRPGVCSEMGELRKLVIGEVAGGSSSPRAAAVAALLAPSRISVTVSGDIRADVWTKLMGNCSLNCVAALTHAGLDAILAHGGARGLVEALMAELIAVAAAATGYAPPMSIAQRLELSARLGAFRPSTLQDVEAGRRLEVGALIGAVVELAGRCGVNAPMLGAVAALVDLRSAGLEAAGAAAASASAAAPRAAAGRSL